MNRSTRYCLFAGLALLAVGGAAAGLSGRLSDSPLNTTLLCGALVLSSFIIFVVLLRCWMKPIRSLAEQMKEVREGALTKISMEREDEIGEIAGHYNAMVEGLRGAQVQSVELARKQAGIEKFAALGRLSAGVAHEINNPVGGILTCLETLKDIEPGSPRYREYIQLVQSGLERIGKIVGQLLKFSRKQEGTREPLDVNTVLEEVVVLSRFQNRDDRVRIVRKHAAVPLVNGAPDLLNQLFLNLVLNGLQAMPEGGTLTLSTSSYNGFIHVVIEDTGPGIAQENLDRIFEPFMTTKEVGVGTGLGLSVAMGIVESHGGTIEVRNRNGGGARFTVQIPAADDLAVAPAEA